jgi:hypothetical protein
MTSASAVLANVVFLAVVASWRVALYAVFLKRTAALSPGRAIVGTLLPLAIIVVVLSLLNLEHVVFNIMGGLRANEASQNDGAYMVVLMLSLLSSTLAPLLFIAYLILVYRSWRGAQQGISRG